MLLHFLSTLFLTVCSLCNIVERENGLEIIIQKYKALGVSEISEVRNELYDFRFCACDSESAYPESSSGCRCSAVVTGQTASNSIPHALYSSSCVHNPNYNKCLVARITASAKQTLLYVKIGIGMQRLTDPPYQSIVNSRFKNTALLSCSTDNNCPDCIPCKSGFIQLNYVSLSNRPATESKSAYISAATESDKTNRWSSKPFKKLAFTESNIDELSTITEIKEYLLESAKKHHLLPSQFDIDAYKDALVTKHNIYRSKHGVGPLKSNSELERFAQLWAHHLANKADCLLHDPSKRYGENLFFYATDLLPDEVTMALMTAQSFYLEAHGYNYKTHQQLDYHRTGHFTQLIWKSTTHIGIGVAMRYFDGRRTNTCQPNFPSYLIYVVVKYDPPGNILSRDHYNENVLPPVQ